MSLTHLYVKDNNGLLVLGFPQHISDLIACESGFGKYNSYTDFTGILPIFATRFAELSIYKKDDTIEVPSLGLSAHFMKYLTISDILPD
jgi:hypothetical protein